MKKTCSVLLLLAVSKFAIANECLDALSISANQSSKSTIEFILRNKTSADFEMNQADLPWGNRYSLVAMAAHSRNGRPLESAYIIDDPGPLSIVVGANAELVGKIDLSYYFKNIEDELSGGDVVFFWHYRGVATNENCLVEIGGWIPLANDN